MVVSIDLIVIIAFFLVMHFAPVKRGGMDAVKRKSSQSLDRFQVLIRNCKVQEMSGLFWTHGAILVLEKDVR
jgi:hypothetical protein